MNSTNDEKEVKSDQTCGLKGKTYYIEVYKALETRLRGVCDLNERTQQLCEAWRLVHTLCERSAASTHHHLLNWLECHTSRTILLTEWQSPKSKGDHISLAEAIATLIEECKAAITERNGLSPPWEVQVVERGEWYRRTLENPWGHPVLRVLLDPRCDQPSDDEILKWLKEERGLTFALRLRQLAASKCDDLAATLVGAVMDRARADIVTVPDHEQMDKEDPPDKPLEPNEVPTFTRVLKHEAGFTQDLWELLVDLEFVLLHKCDKVSKCIELAKQTPLRHGYLQVERLQNRRTDQSCEKKLWKNAKDVAILIAQVVIARCMVVPVCAHAAVTALYRCARGLARMVPAARLPAAAATLAAPAATARHLHTLAAAVHAQCTVEMRPFVCELYVRAITAGMNELERLKLKTEKASEARASEQTLSSWFTQLGGLLSASDRIKFECTLTAFSVHPSPAMYERIKCAPVLPPVAGTEEINVKEETTSEFGSWATDSRTQTNLVKTSETLNIKQIQQQANVLSTAILTEGEALGLTPELCQDLAVLLSGPRVKTLSWDMNRDSLLENCRTYMERTHGGTRALTTELKYLNLDPSSYEHLPMEEEEDENDLYYGIEKGYEHLVEFQDQDDLWQSTMFDTERTETGSSCGETDFELFRRKKKSKKQNKVVKVKEEKDPLSIVPEIKSEKKERPHSKERISKEKKQSKEKKERKKKDKSSEGSTVKKDHSLDRPKDSEQKEENGVSLKEKKKEKKPRKKKPKEVKEEFPVPSKPGSLSNLIGLKVVKMNTPQSSCMKNTETKQTPCINDTDNDSHSKPLLASLNWQGNDPTVVFDGLFSMDDYKSPEKQDPLSDRNYPSTNELSIKENQVAVNMMQTPKPAHLEPSLSLVVEKTNTTSSNASEEVKKSITKLLEYRRQKSLPEITQKQMKAPTSSQKKVIKHQKPNAIVQQVFPEQTIISPKAVNVPEIPKVYINKNQVELSQDLKTQVGNSVKPIVSQKSVIHNESLFRTNNKHQHIVYADYNTFSSTNLEALSRTQSPSLSNPNMPLDLQQTPRQSNDSPTQQNFEDFIRELTKSINAGTLQTKSMKSYVGNKTVKKDLDLKSISADVSPVRYVKNEQRKKVEMQLDTFARRSYIHNKNRQLGTVKSQNSPLGRTTEEPKATKLKYDKEQNVLHSLLSQNAAHTSPIVRNVIKAPEKTFHSEQNVLSYTKVATQKPPTQHKITHGNKNIHLTHPQDNTKMLTPATHSQESSLSDKDQLDILQILRQKTNLNKQSLVTVFNNDQINVNKIRDNSQNTKKNSSSKEFYIESAMNSCIKLNTNSSHKHETTQIITAIGLPSQTTVKVKTSKPSKTPTVVNLANKNVNISQNQQFTPPTTAPGLKTNTPKVTSKTKDSTQEWTKVMDALLAQKTPTRGVNALDAVMKGNYSDLCNQSTMRPSIIKHSNKEQKAGSVNNNTTAKMSSDGSITKMHSQTKDSTSTSDIGNSLYGLKVQKFKFSDNTADNQTKYSTMSSIPVCNADSQVYPETKLDCSKTPLKIKKYASKKPTPNLQAFDTKAQALTQTAQNKKKNGQSFVTNVELTAHAKKTVTLPNNQILLQDQIQLSNRQAYNDTTTNISQNTEQSVIAKKVIDAQLNIQDRRQFSTKQSDDKTVKNIFNSVRGSSNNVQMTDVLKKQVNYQTYGRLPNKEFGEKVTQVMSLKLPTSLKNSSSKETNKNTIHSISQNLERPTSCKGAFLNNLEHISTKNSNTRSISQSTNKPTHIDELPRVPNRLYDEYDQALQQKVIAEQPYTYASKVDHHVITSKKQTDVLTNKQILNEQQTHDFTKQLEDKVKLLQQDYIKRITCAQPHTVTNTQNVGRIAEELKHENGSFASSFENSDYDILEELMDDELRQEIGELSSDEGDTANVTTNIKASKLRNMYEGNNVINKNSQIKLNAFSGNNSQRKICQSIMQPLNKLNTNKINCNYDSKPDILSRSVSNIADNKLFSKVCAPTSKMSNISTATCQNQTVNTTIPSTRIVQQQPLLTSNSSVINIADKKQLPKKPQVNVEIPVISTVTFQNRVTNILSNQSVPQEPSILAANSVNVVDAGNIIITSLPQSAVGNVLLIRPELVYDPYTEVCNVTQRPYIAVSNTPNVTVYQTTQFAVPAVNPVLIGTTANTLLPTDYSTVPATVTDTSTVINKDFNDINAIDHFFETTADNDIIPKKSTTCIKKSVESDQTEHMSNNKESICQDINTTVPIEIKTNKTIDSDKKKEVSKQIETKFCEDMNKIVVNKTKIADDVVSSNQTKQKFCEDMNKIVVNKTKIVDDVVSSNQTKQKFCVDMNKIVVNKTKIVDDVVSSNQAKQVIPQKETKTLMDMNKNCDRKVLSEVQERLIIDKNKHETQKELESNDNQIKNTPESNKFAVIENEKAHKRVEIKRLAIINRQINHRSNMPPIVLSYLPLPQNNPNNLASQNKINIIGHTISDENTVITNHEKLSENSKENSKEIKSMFLRSSKESISDEGSILNRNISERLTQKRDKIKGKRELSKVNKRIKKSRQSNKARKNKNKKLTGSALSSSKRKSMKKNIKIHNDCDDDFNKTLMDFEEELSASRIPKYESVKSLQATQDNRQFQSSNTNNNDDIKRASEVNINQVTEKTFTQAGRYHHLESKKKLDLSQNEQLNVVDGNPTDCKFPLYNNVNSTLKNIDMNSNEASHASSVSVGDIFKENSNSKKEQSKDIVADDALFTDIETGKNDTHKIFEEVGVQNINECSDQNKNKCVATTSELKKMPLCKNDANQTQSEVNNAIQKENNPNDLEYKLLQDNIVIETIPLPNGNPNKRCVRIKMPNGKVFKATVFGHNNVSIESLFSNEFMRTTLMENLQSTQRYTLNIKHVIKPTEKNPDKIVNMEIENINMEPSNITKPIECVSLLSDDEDDSNARSLKTEFGTFKVTSLESEDLIKHQKKLDQTCVVVLTKSNLHIKPQLAVAESVNKQHTESLEPSVNPGLDSLSITCKKSDIYQLSTTSKSDIPQKDNMTMNDERKHEGHLEAADKAYSDSLKSNDVSPSSAICAKTVDLLSTTTSILSELKQNADDLISSSSTMRNDKQVHNETIIPTASSITEIVHKDAKLNTHNKSIYSQNKQDNNHGNPNGVMINMLNKDSSSKVNTIFTSEVIEVEDSSNDSIDLLSDCALIPNQLVQEPNETPVSDKINGQDGDKIIELKSLLLRDLGVGDFVNTEESTTVDTFGLDVSDCEENLVQPIITKNCLVELIKCDELVKKYEYKKILNQKCYVDLVRCDAEQNSAANCMTEEQRFFSNDYIDMGIEDDAVSCSDLSRSGSFSLLTDYPFNIEETTPNIASSNFYYNDRSSPVIEIFETIAAFNNYPRRNNENIYCLNENMVKDHYQCCSDWNKTKHEIYIESKIINNHCKSVPEYWTCYYNITESTVKSVPSLKSLTTNIFQDYSVLDRYSLIRKLKPKPLFENIEVSTRRCTNLKRKLKNVNTSESSREKKICKNNVMDTSKNDYTEIKKKSNTNFLPLKGINSVVRKSESFIKNSIELRLNQDIERPKTDRNIANKMNSMFDASKEHVQLPKDLTKENGKSSSQETPHFIETTNNTGLKKCEESFEAVLPPIITKNDFTLNESLQTPIHMDIIPILSKKVLFENVQLSKLNTQNKLISENEDNNINIGKQNEKSEFGVETSKEKNEIGVHSISNNMTSTFDNVDEYENINQIIKPNQSCVIINDSEIRPNVNQIDLKSDICVASIIHTATTASDCDEPIICEIKEIIESTTCFCIDRNNDKEQTEISLIKSSEMNDKECDSTNITSPNYGNNEQVSLSDDCYDLDNFKKYHSGSLEIIESNNEIGVHSILNNMTSTFDNVDEYENINQIIQPNQSCDIINDSEIRPNVNQIDLKSDIWAASNIHIATTASDCDEPKICEIKEKFESTTSICIDRNNDKEQTEISLIKSSEMNDKECDSTNITSPNYGNNKQVSLSDDCYDLNSFKKYHSGSLEIIESKPIPTMSDITEEIHYCDDFIEIEISNNGKLVEPADSHIELQFNDNQELVHSYDGDDDVTLFEGDSAIKHGVIITVCLELLDHTYAIGINVHNDKSDSNKNECEEKYSETASIEDTEMLEDSFDKTFQKEVTLVYKDGSDLVLKGIEYEDPVVGTCYVFPLTENLHLPHDHMYLDDLVEASQEQDNAFDHDLKVEVPKVTYSKTENLQLEAVSRKRKLVDIQMLCKKYRKGKNIDYPKLTAAATANSTYSKEYKRVFDYCDSLKISLSQPYHKEVIDVENIVKNWPIKGSLCENAHNTDNQSNILFYDDEDVQGPVNPSTLTLVEELNVNYRDDTEQIAVQDSVEGTNFNMGFGERSDRVIQNLENTDDVTNVSAATLSDVKQPQPFLLSEDKYQTLFENTFQDQIRNINRFVKCFRMRDKVRLFFERTTVELQYDCIKKSDKNNIFDDQYSYNNNIFPFDYCNSDFIDPTPFESVVQVVQIGQSLVSAAAQNAVTCDPRVTQVSEVSPSQCSIQNSPQDNSEVTIKTEYTELMTADITNSVVQEYVQQNQTLAVESQNQSNLMASNENIPTETEIKSVVKIEIMEELPEIKKENEFFEIDDSESLENQQSNSVTYSMEPNNDENHITEEPHVRYQTNYQSPTGKQNDMETFSQPKVQNGIPEKTDQIAHAMNAAGITTTSETMANTNRTHALVNIISQKSTPENLNSAQTGNNSYSKATAINAMALQQALAQILPPPLNQSGSSDNNQSNNPQVTPQVLHIVQGKNPPGGQITLVDNAHQSVINTPNTTPVLHIVQNKTGSPGTNSNVSASQSNSFSGISLVDTGLQQGGNQLLHIVNTGGQKNNATSQLLKRVNLLTNLANVQGSNDQKMVQFVCKSADGKTIQLNAPHQRGMVLRLQPIEPTNINIQTGPPKSVENHEVTSTMNTTNSNASKDCNSSQQEIKSRSVYEENYAKFIQNTKSTGSEKSTTLPKFNQAFGKPVFQEGNQKQNDLSSNNAHLAAVNNTSDNSDCQSTDNAMNLDQVGQINSPPLLLRKSPAQQSTSTQPQANLVQQFKQTAAMNIQTMHGGVIYTRQIPVIGGGQTINLITVPSTELLDDSSKQQLSANQNEIESSIIKIVPQNQPTTNTEAASEDGPAIGGSNETSQNLQPQPVLTQMRIKLPMLSKTPQMVSGARVVRPSFFQIQRNVIGGTNQPVYQQLVLTTAPTLGQQTIRLPQTQSNRQIKVSTENQSSPESQMSSSTLEQLREFDMVLEQVKERSTTQPSSSNTTFSKLSTSSTDTKDNIVSASSTSSESTQKVLYSGSNNQQLTVACVNRKSVTTSAASALVRSPDSSGIVESSSSANNTKASHTKNLETTQNDPPPTSTQSKPSKSSSKSKSKSKSHNASMKLNTVPPKSSSQKPLEDEQTTQRILYILAEYKEQVENSPDKDKPAPRRRTNPPLNPLGHSKRKKSSCSSRRHSCRDLSPVYGEDSCRTMGSEDSSCGTSLGDCNESCLEIHSPQESPRKVARKLTFEQENPTPQPLPQPQRNVIVADGQTITVARGTAGKPATAVLMPANYILPVSMVKGGQQIAIVTNRGPKLLTLTGGEGGTTNALLLQRLIGPAGLKPVLTRPGVRHVRLPTAALHNLQAFNLAATAAVQAPDSTAPSVSAPTPPELVDTRATSSPWPDRAAQDTKPESSNNGGSEPWHFEPIVDPLDYSYEETVRTENLERTVLDPIPDRYSPDMEAQRIFDKMFDVDSKKSYLGDSHDDSPHCAYDIDASDCDDKAYHQVVHKKDGTSHRQHRFPNVSSAALRHKYAILEHELRLQKSLSEECEDLGVDSPSASELFPEAELLFSSSPAHEHVHEQVHHPHTPQPTILSQGCVPQPDLDDQIATDHLLTQHDVCDDQSELHLGLDDVGGMITVSEDGQTTIALDHEEFARSHPNTTFHSEEPTEEMDMQPYTIAGLKGRHITSTIFHAGRAPATVLMATPQTTVISQATAVANGSSETVKYADIDNMIDSLPTGNGNSLNLGSVLVKDDGLTRFDGVLSDCRELHLSNTAAAIVHAAGNATQVIRRVCYEDDKRDPRFLMDEPEGLIAGDGARMMAEENSRDAAAFESMAGDPDDDRSSPERHADMFWESNSASERSEGRRPLDYSSDSDKCCKSPYDETNSTDSSGIGTHMRLDSVIKNARGLERRGSGDGSSADEPHPPTLRTYPPKRAYYPVLEGEMERSLSGKTRAGERSPEGSGEGGRRRASGRGVVKRGCHCCNGSPAPTKTKKSRQRKPTDYSNN